MTGVVITFVVLALICTVIVVLDWRARRKDRQSENRPAA
jgi:hypothetical protein